MQLRPPLPFIVAAFFFLTASSVLAADRWVIQFKESTIANNRVISPAEQVETQKRVIENRLSELKHAHKRNMMLLRPFGDRGAVIHISQDGESVEQVRQRLLSDPLVESVELDRRIHLNAVSPLIPVLNAMEASKRSRSWIHHDLASQPASINTGAMWANFHGTAPTVVAVVDTGVLPSHPMLQGHLLPGYDFISDPAIAADGQSTGRADRDDDPTDPGDGVTAADLQDDPSCGSLKTSGWHGTFVAGLLAGNPDSVEGIFPVNWNASILPVRVLGKCGGFSSDLADGIRWAAGLNVPGVPNNPFPAKVINLSLGTTGACVSAIEGAAVLAARRAGVLVVAASGNNGGTVDSPANCPGSFAVTSVDQLGLKANYSNVGSSIQLSAPGGDAAFPIWSASNTGTTSALANTYSTKTGTSFSAPLVAGAASLYWSLNPAASVDTVENLLKSTARPFLSIRGRSACTPDMGGVQCNCTRALCGAGMLDVANLVNTQASGGLTNLFSNTGNVIPPGQIRTFSAAGSTNSAGQEMSSVSFDVINVLKSNPGASDPVLSVNGLNVSITAPAAGLLGFDLRAQVPGAREAIVPVVVAASGASTFSTVAGLMAPLKANSPATNDFGTNVTVADTGGQGGGGAINLASILIFAYLLLASRNRQ